MTRSERRDGSPPSPEPRQAPTDLQLPARPEFYRRVLDDMPSPLLVVDEAGTIIYGNRALVTLTGWGVADGIGTNLLDHIHPDDRRWVTDAFTLLTVERETVTPASSGPWATIHLRMTARDGTVIPLEVTGIGRLDDESIGGVIYDVRPAGSQHLLANVLHGIASGVLVRDLLSLVIETVAAPPLDIATAVLEPDGAGSYEVIVATSEDLAAALTAATNPIPWSSSEADATFIKVGDLPVPLAKSLSGHGYVDFWHLAVESTITSSTYRLVACTKAHHAPSTGVIDRLARARELAGVVLLRAQTDALLAHAASHDDLTQLPNRVGFMQQITGNDTTVPDTYTALYIDLDAFKPVNDEFGHDAGDLVLQVVADRLRSESRSDDLVARLGGDEFVIVLGPESTAVLTRERATNAADRLLEVISEPIEIEGGAVEISASIGIAVAGRDADIDSVLAAADAAMYEAKRAGGSRRRLVTTEA